MSKREIRLLVIFSIFCFIPVIFFINTFWDSFISEDITKWGAFGDYFGSFFSFISVCVTIYIAYNLSKIEKNRPLLVRASSSYPQRKIIIRF